MCIFARHFNYQNMYSVIIIGGGIVGLASALKLKIINPKLKIAVIEKENELAKLLSSSSGVSLPWCFNFLLGFHRKHIFRIRGRVVSEGRASPYQEGWTLSSVRISITNSRVPRTCIVAGM